MHTRTLAQRGLLEDSSNLGWREREKTKKQKDIGRPSERASEREGGGMEKERGGGERGRQTDRQKTHIERYFKTA